MVLPFVDFTSVDEIPVKLVDFPGAGAAGQLSIRKFNEDPDTGAKTMVVTLPAGLTVDAGHWSCDLEILILQGQLTLGSEDFDRYCYLFVPSGVAVDALTVGSEDVTVLVFTSATAHLNAGSSDAAGAPRHRVVGPVHVGDLPWEKPKTEGFPVGAARKTLRDDPETGESFWILGVLPHWSSPHAEWHTFTEEAFVLEGEMETPVGLMEAGSYLSHFSGPDSIHGPLRSRHGFLLAIRAKGPMGTEYEPATEELAGRWR